ncbi:hypothetical protein JHK86_027719 [Glycine max]|nr:hypothetical protein JHK86_027719 [Glycine max]
MYQVGTGLNNFTLYVRKPSHRPRKFIGDLMQCNDMMHDDMRTRQINLML